MPIDAEVYGALKATGAFDVMDADTDEVGVWWWAWGVSEGLHSKTGGWSGLHRTNWCTQAGLTAPGSRGNPFGPHAATACYQMRMAGAFQHLTTDCYCLGLPACLKHSILLMRPCPHAWLAACPSTGGAQP